MVRLPVSMAFSVAVHSLLLFGVLRTLPILFDQPPLFTVLDVTLSKTAGDLSPEQAYLNSEQAQRGVLSVEPDRAYASEAYEGATSLSGSSNAQFFVPAGFRNDDLWLKYNHRAVKKRTVSAASHQAKDAAYLSHWREKIERMGTQQYQESIAAIATSGNLLMLVAIDQAGELVEIQIRRSSGSAELDALAVDIVQQAAPFAPLPEAMWGDTEVLEIIRTWKFRANP